MRNISVLILTIFATGCNAENETSECEFGIETFSGSETAPTRAYINAWFENEKNSSPTIYSYTQVTADLCGGVLVKDIGWKMLFVDQTYSDWGYTNVYANIGQVFTNFDEATTEPDVMLNLAWNFSPYEHESYMLEDGSIAPVPDGERRFTNDLGYGIYVPPGETYTFVMYVRYDGAGELAVDGDSLRFETSAVYWEPADDDRIISPDAHGILPVTSDPITF